MPEIGETYMIEASEGMLVVVIPEKDMETELEF
jgi:hypothetical protein